MTEDLLISTVFHTCMSLLFTSIATDRLTQRGISDAEAKHSTTEADLTLFPPVSPPGSPCWFAPRLPLSTPGRTNPRIRGCRGEVYVWVCVCECRGCCLCPAPTTSAGQSHRGNQKRHKILLILPSFWSSFLLSTPTQDCVYACVRSQAARPVSE